MIHFFGQNQTKEARKFIIISATLLLAIGGLVYFFFSQSNSTLLKSTAIDAVPLHASSIIQFKNSDDFFDAITKNTFFSNILGDSTLERLRFLKSVFEEMAAPGKELADCRITISSHHASAGGIDFLIIAELNKPKHWNDWQKTFSAILSSKNTLNERNFDNAAVYDLNFSEKQQNLSFTLQNNLLIVSMSPFLVEDAIRQLNSGKTVLNTAELNDATQGPNQLASVYLNYKSLPNACYPLLNNASKEGLNFLKSAGPWSHFSLSVQNSALLLNGFTATPEDPAQYFSLLKGQKPVAIELPEIFPNRTAAFVNLGISNYAEFKVHSKQYMQKHGQVASLNATLIYASKKYSIDLEKNASEWVGNELALVLTENNGDTLANNQLAFIKTDYPEKASTLLEQIVGVDSVQIKKIKFTERYKNQKIYFINLPGFLSTIGGSLFNQITRPYAVVIKNHLICANKVDELKKYIDDYFSLQTLEQNERFAQLKAYYAREGNLLAFACTERNLQLIRNSTLITVDNIFNNHPIDFKNLYGACFQISNNNNRFFTNLTIKYNSDNKAKTGLLWSLALDNPISMQPQVVINHNNQEKEIAVQDDKNILYLISNTGKVIWKRQLPEKIISSIYQVDFYKNDKLQMIFNSANHLYMYDRLGNPTSGYPIRLSSTASTGLAVFDYDHDRNYRIFIPCDNKAIYGYQVTGKPLEGWGPKNTIGLVKQPVQYLRIDKDYLVISNTEGTVFIFNRKGQTIKELKALEKVQFLNPFVADETSKPGETQFVTTNVNGTIQRYYLNGNVSTRKLGDWTEKHFFDFINVADGADKEYIFLDREQLAVYSKKDSALVYSYEFLNDITLRPQSIPVDSSKYSVGVTVTATNQVFAFDDNGKILRGFPLKGSTPFTISNFRNDSRHYLLVGSSDTYVYVYVLD